MEDDDYALYRDWLAQACRSNGVEVWSYCLMPNHVHLILVPSDETGLSRAVGETHRRYSGYINARLRVRIPDEGDRRFHAKTTTNSTRRRPPIPVKTATSG
jgi:REP element-mobilizing transposase RayT